MKSDSRRVVIDLGSRSFHAVLYQQRGHQLIAERDWKDSPRLHAHLEGGQLSRKAIERGRLALTQLGRWLEDEAPGCPVSAVATGALREADNRDAILDWARDTLGLSIEVLTGADEARLAYAGAIHASDVHAGARVWVIDFGGGSTEVAMGHGHRCERLHSVALGALELATRYVSPDGGLDDHGRQAIAGQVQSRLQLVARDVSMIGVDQVILACGAARALGKFGEDLGLHRAGQNMSRVTLARMVSILSQFRPTEMTALGIEDARSDTIAVAALVLSELLAVMGVEGALISYGGLREGVALRKARSSIASLVQPGFYLAVT